MPFYGHRLFKNILPCSKPRFFSLVFVYIWILIIHSMKRSAVVFLLTVSVLSVFSCARQGSEFRASDEGSVILSDKVSNQRINGFSQDRYGHIWMATGRGLNRFDSHDFHHFFCTDDTLGLPDNQINNVLVASDGVLWVATVNGVAYGTPQGNFHRVPILGNNRNVITILEAPDGKLLFTNSTSLYTYDKEEDILRPVVREFNAFGNPLMVIGKDGGLWMVSGGGFVLNRYNPSNFSLEQSFEIPFQAFHICDAGNGDLWLSGMGRIGVFDELTGQWKELPSAVKAERRIMEGDVDMIFPVDVKSLLLNVIGKGFFLYSSGSEKISFQYDADFPFEIPSNEVRTIFRDKDGNLWFGTTDQGYYISHQAKSQFGGNKFLASAFKGKSVMSLAPDKTGNLWIATLRDGLWRYDLANHSLEQVDISHFIADKRIGYIRSSTVFCDSSGDIWLLFADKMRVVHCIWNGSRLVLRDMFFAYNPISLAEDDQGNVWIGCFGQHLLRFERKTRSVTQVPVTSEGEWTFVPSLVMKEPGKLLAGCFNHPRVEVNTYTLEAQPIPVSDEERNSVIKRSVIIPNCMFLDSARDLWVGTMANGLMRRQKSTGQLQSMEGLPCLDISSIEEDRQGHLWVSTMNGLAKYDRTTGRFVNYFESDGIGGNQFSDRASCVLEDGTLVFGGTHGITWFNPLDAPAKRNVRLVFEDLTIHNQLVRPSEGAPIDKELYYKPDVTVPYNQNSFNISFAALDYNAFEQIRYAYKLEGFDDDWVELGTRHDAYFSNVPVGRYVLKVRINDGSHSVTEVEENLNVRVLRPWYTSWWAILLWTALSLFLIGMVYSFYRRIRRVRKEAASRIREIRREREKAEEAEKAEKELNRIQMNYFSNVAHEFRTPLTMIAGPAQQLASSPMVQGDDRKLAGIIRRNSAWMLSLVNQLLDFNRIGNSKLQLKVTKMDIVPPLRDTSDIFRFNASSKGIELTTSGLEDSFTMWVDADKVQKVVMNLLSNALKFTPEGGRVHLGFDVVSREEVATLFSLSETDTDGQWACISVSDSGCGIAEGEIEKIFERFYQGGDGKKAYGSGIGLFYARALAGFHHGYIKAWNKPEGGAIFRLVLPASAASYTEDERTEEKPQLQLHALAADISSEIEDENGKKKIAVVDDDIDIANYLKILLSPSYKVSLYFDGNSALKGMEEDIPDLVVSDVVMPGMDGYELCSSIKGNLQLSHVPVVLVTAKVAVESQVQGLGKGADAYVTKPFQPEYLLALVKSLLENREKLHRQLGSVTSTEEIASEALSPRDAAFMKDLYDLMEKELADADLDIVRMAEKMKISRTKFYYKVKGLTGENPSVFFKRYKLNRAAALLKEGKYNMSEIAWMTGFNTLSHFSTSFKKQFGVPPSDYKG